MVQIKPDFSNSSDLKDLIQEHSSARTVLTSGDAECALIKAHGENEPELFAAALIMCGAVERHDEANAVIDAEHGPN